ncbi:MAG: site-2 protease family protein [bacterium]
MENVITLILTFIAFFICLSVHEAAHSFIADKLGDPTSKHEGRLSLNPLRHIDLFGTILLPLFLIISGLPAFGWAKPVMVNIYNFKNPARDHFLTALSGPASNLIFAVILGVIVGLIPSLSFLTILIRINVILALFNLLPIPPLDGSKIWHLVLSEESYFNLERYGPFILIAFLLLFGSGADFLFNLGDSLSNAIIHLI